MAVKKDFHVLNVKYTRAEYFRIVRALEEELGLAGSGAPARPSERP